jgi:hypothetical protein
MKPIISMPHTDLAQLGPVSGVYATREATTASHRAISCGLTAVHEADRATGNKGHKLCRAMACQRCPNTVSGRAGAATPGVNMTRFQCRIERKRKHLNQTRSVMKESCQMFETQSCHGSLTFTFLSELLQVFRSEELGHRSVSGTTDYNLRERQRELCRELVIRSACE